MQDELSLIAAFVKRSKRDRYREMLSNPRRRHKFTSQLGHFTDFDSKYRLPLPSDQLFVDNIAVELRKRRSPNIVLVVSENTVLDQKKMPLLEALNEIVGRGMGTVLSCIPGHLAFVETEDDRFILERHDPLERREYIRFVIGRDPADHRDERGIFQGVALALEWETIIGSDADALRKLQAWFGQHLKKPTSSGRDEHRFGVCWFKTDATRYIEQIQEMVVILERNGISVQKIKTDKPGYLIYEDDWQLVAELYTRSYTRRGK